VKRILILAMLVAALLLGGYGCMQNNPIQSSPAPSGAARELNTGALAYMEQKYGETFEYAAPWGSSYTTPGKRQILVSCASMPDKEILVVISGDGASESYADNYMDFYFAPQSAAYLKQAADPYFDDTAVDINIARSPAPGDVTLATAFEDYIAHADHVVNGDLTVPDLTEAAVQSFAEELRSRGVHFSLSLTNAAADEGYTVQYFGEDSEVFVERRKL
jgi:hypothetical protein